MSKVRFIPATLTFHSQGLGQTIRRLKNFAPAPPSLDVGAQTCVGHNIAVDPDTKAAVRVRCANPVIHTQHGWLCRDHTPRPTAAQSINYGDVEQDIINRDHEYIIAAMARKDKNVLRLTDFRYCRHIWNQRGQ